MSGKRDGVTEASNVCTTSEEVKLTKDEYRAAGSQVTIIEVTADTP